MTGVEYFTDSFVVTFLLGILTLIFVYWFSTRNHDYWKKRGVPYIKPLPFIGNVLDIYKAKSFHELDMERFKKFGNIYGYFEGQSPLLSFTDPKLIREVFVKDFSSFTSHRTVKTGEKVFDCSLPIVNGEDWKRLRTIISPTFTTGKIKRLLNIFKEGSKTLIQNFCKVAEEKKFIDVKRFYAAFTMDVIASASFSTKLDSHNDPENKFVKAAKSFFTPNVIFLRVAVLFILIPPRLMMYFGKKIIKNTIGFFKDVTLQIIEERKRTGQIRNDFLQLLLDTMKEEDEAQNENISDNEKEGDIAYNYGEHDVGQQIYKNVTSKSLTLDELVAQCIQFFIGGTETTASTLSLVTYLLAVHPNEREKLQQEVDSILQETGGELTYEAIQSMKYLDNVISETLRMYPPLVRLERMADRSHKLGNTGITIPKGMLVSCPARVVHWNPSIYPNPEKFDPDRFNPLQKAEREPYTYLPFGVGPRNCVAMRFALMEIKICIAYVIANFHIKHCLQTKIPLEFNFSPALLMPKDIIVDMQIRNDCPLKM